MSLWGDSGLYHFPSPPTLSERPPSPDDDGQALPDYDPSEWYDGDSYSRSTAGGSQATPLYNADLPATLDTIGNDDERSLQGVHQDQTLEADSADGAIERDTLPISHKELFKNTQLLRFETLNVIPLLVGNETRSFSTDEMVGILSSSGRRIIPRDLSSSVDSFNENLNRLEAGSFKKEKINSNNIKYTFERGERFYTALKLHEHVAEISEKFHCSDLGTSHLSLLSYLEDQRHHSVAEMKDYFSYTKRTLQNTICALNKVLKRGEKARINHIKKDNTPGYILQTT